MKHHYSCTVPRRMAGIALLAIASFIPGYSDAQLVYKDVAPIFYSRCTSCHHEGQPAPSMLNYSQTYPKSGIIKNYLQIGKMPPWPPDTTYRRFLHERLITSSEQNDIISWINSGSIKGDTMLAPPVPTYQQYKLTGTPDLIMKIPTFTSNASSQDAYNCFALPTGFTTDRILRAYEIVPGNPAIVHHVVVTVDTNGTATNDLSGGCFAQPGDFGIGGYAPGTPPTVFTGEAPLKAGIRIKAGSKIVLQIHYPLGTAGQKDSTQMRLYFYPAGTTGVRDVIVETTLQNWQLYLPPNTVQTYSAKWPPVGTFSSALSLYAVFPHAHKINKNVVIYAYRTSPPDTIPIVRVNNWDFEWQGYYTFKKPLKIPVGYKVFSQHVYDNTVNNPNNPNSPPVLVTAGTSTTDEMLFDSFQYLSYQAGDDTIDVGALLANDPLLNPLSSPIIYAPEISSSVYPNPFSENADLFIGNPGELSIDNAAIKFFDLYGKEVNVEIIRQSNRLHIRSVSLPAGAYFYSVKTNTSIGNGKFIVVK